SQQLVGLGEHAVLAVFQLGEVAGSALVSPAVANAEDARVGLDLHEAKVLVAQSEELHGGTLQVVHKHPGLLRRGELCELRGGHYAATFPPMTATSSRYTVMVEMATRRPSASSARRMAELDTLGLLSAAMRLPRDLVSSSAM